MVVQGFGVGDGLLRPPGHLRYITAQKVHTLGQMTGVVILGVGEGGLCNACQLHSLWKGVTAACGR